MTKIKSIKVSRTFLYDPESYLEFCEEVEETPTQEGFLAYLMDWIYDDFDTSVECIGDLDVVEVDSE